MVAWPGAGGDPGPPAAECPRATAAAAVAGEGGGERAAAGTAAADPGSASAQSPCRIPA